MSQLSSSLLMIFNIVSRCPILQQSRNITARKLCIRQILTLPTLLTRSFTSFKSYKANTHPHPHTPPHTHTLITHKCFPTTICGSAQDSHKLQGRLVKRCNDRQEFQGVTTVTVILSHCKEKRAFNPKAMSFFFSFFNVSLKQTH